MRVRSFPPGDSLDRLGLEKDSPQLRCLGTSASLDGKEGLSYLEQFFVTAERRDKDRLLKIILKEDDPEYIGDQ